MKHPSRNRRSPKLPYQQIVLLSAISHADIKTIRRLLAGQRVHEASRRRIEEGAAHLCIELPPPPAKAKAK